MASWNDLYVEARHINQAPEAAIFAFIQFLEEIFDGKTMDVWDLGCGVGRNAMAIGLNGHRVYGSDISERGIQQARNVAKKLGVDAEFSISDMTECPWKIDFDAVIAWNVINHNTTDGIKQTISEIHSRLRPGGYVLVTFKSTKAFWYGKGKEVEPNTFMPNEGDEAGVLHHYFDKEEVMDLMSKFNISVFCDLEAKFQVTDPKPMRYRPFPYTGFYVIAQKIEISI